MLIIKICIDNIHKDTSVNRINFHSDTSLLLIHDS